MDENEFFKKAKSKFSVIRGRTWILTLTIVGGLILYFLVNVGIDDSINPVDFVTLCALQIIVHLLYFPDGEINGQRDPDFIKNKKAYNEKALQVNQSKKIGRLREYCKAEYEERKQRYILNECGAIGITYEELQELKNIDAKTIKTMQVHEFVYQDGSKLVHFTKNKRKRLYNLLFKDIPVKENKAETIMSGSESESDKSIIDMSKSYKRTNYLLKLFLVVVVGAVLTYVATDPKNGFTLADATKLVIYFTSILTTGITAFSAGEKNTRENKSKFYVDLSNFIDAFDEWDAKTAVKVNTLQSQVEETKQIEKVVD